MPGWRARPELSADDEILWENRKDLARVKWYWEGDEDEEGPALPSSLVLPEGLPRKRRRIQVEPDEEDDLVLILGFVEEDLDESS